jgi:hypothetical protein
MRRFDLVFLGGAAAWWFLVAVLAVLASPCCLSGLFALPLCGAAPTFFAAAKKVGKESGLATASP